MGRPERRSSWRWWWRRVAWSQELSMNYMAVPQHLFDSPTSPKPKQDPKPNKIKASTATSTSTSSNHKSSSPAIGTVSAS
jgi:hypothetical protein